MGLTGGAELNALTEHIIGCAFAVGSTLGSGFLEKVYERALLIKLTEAGLLAITQHPIRVQYHGHIVGDYIADLWSKTGS